MQPDDLLYLGHMLDMARKACERASELDRDEYEFDEDVQVGSDRPGASDRGGGTPRFCGGSMGLPANPGWEIIGMRNRIVHDYLGVDEDVMWEVVTGDLPALVEILERVVPVE